MSQEEPEVELMQDIAKGLGYRDEVCTYITEKNLTLDNISTHQPPTEMQHDIDQLSKYAKKRKEERFSKVVKDSVHGLITLHPLLVKIVDTPQFQRLRNIKQLGVGYRVYPGASHNRFEHSLGVCHLAKLLVTSLKKKQPELNITDKDVLCVQIAALCHDLGHGPFSHVFDGIFLKGRTPPWKHEEGSCDMFDYMYETNGLKVCFEKYGLKDEDRDFIKQMINVNEKRPDVNNEKLFLYEIVSNKETGIDVDKFDYFARDCHHLGIQTVFDYQRYIEFARVCNFNNGKHICIREKEAFNLYELFSIRKSLFRRAYHHKTTCSIELMICDALKLAEPVLGLSSSIKNMEKYQTFTDNVYYKILLSDDQSKGMVKAKGILERIEKRDLYKMLAEFYLNEEEMKDQQLKDLRNEMENERSDVLFVKSFTVDYGMKEKDPVKLVGFYTEENPNEAKQIGDNQVSRMLPSTFCEEVLRVYYKGDKKDEIQTLKETTVKKWEEKWHKRCLELKRFLKRKCQCESVKMTMPDTADKKLKTSRGKNQ